MEITGAIVAVVFSLIVFLVLREVWCWYWKINAALLELGLIRIELEKLNTREVQKAQRVG